MVTAAQIRAARGLLGLSQVWLAKLAGISPTALVNIETGAGDPKASTLAAIIAALEKEGAEFTNGDQPGVRLRKAKADSEPTEGRKSHRRLERNQARGPDA
jgi:DNA-binding XRE family transcriptional regulator